MSNATSQNKRIAKNTVYLYFRMLFTMAVSLYTSRVVLKTLGVDDFGVYQTVGGIVALIAYANNAFAVGTSRFLTYELGTGNEEKLKKTFSTALSIHIIFSIIIVIIAETIGLWYVYNKLVVDSSRFVSAVFAYHFSVLTIFITITQIPYNSSIISHEKMNVFAYISIVDVLLKLAIVYLLVICDFDKLKLYSVLLFSVQLLIAFFYRFYCIRNFKECRYHLVLDKAIFKSILSFSGWNMVATSAIALCNHGITILLNYFFSPAVVAAKAVANQVNMAANQFVNNFKIASDPVIIKKYAAQQYDESKYLLFETTKISYYMMLILSVPICVVAKPLLRIWLGFVPDYATGFLQVAVVTSLMETINRSFYTALYSTGRIKENACIFAVILCVSFVTIFILLKMGFSPISSMIVMLIAQFVTSVVVKPYLLVKIVGCPLKPILKVLFDCFKVSVIASIAPLILYFKMNEYEYASILSFGLQVLVSIASVASAVWFFGLAPMVKKNIILFVRKKIKG